MGKGTFIGEKDIFDALNSKGKDDSNSENAILTPESNPFSSMLDFRLSPNHECPGKTASRERSIKGKSILVLIFKEKFGVLFLEQTEQNLSFLLSYTENF